MFKKIVKFRVVSTVFFASLLFVLGGSVWAYYALRGIANAPLILHFDDLTGINSVGGPATIAFMGIFGTVVVLLNFAIALAFEERDPFLGKFTAATTFIFAVLLFIAFAAIVRVN